MHIGYLIQQYPPEVGAGPARSSEFAKRWREWGSRISIYTSLPNRPGGRIYDAYRGRLRMQEDLEGIHVVRNWLYASPKHGFMRTIANNLSFMLGSFAGNIARADRPDVLIGSSPPFFVHLSAWALARAWRIPIVLEVRDLWPDYLAGMGAVNGPARDALFGVEKFLFTHADHIVAVTETFRGRIIEKGAHPDRVTAIPNAVDGSLYFRDAGAQPPFEALAKAPDEFVVGYLGNVGASQGKLLALIDAAHRLRNRGDIRFVVCGDGTEAAAFHARLAELQLSNVHVAPPIEKHKTNAFYNCCDACIVPLANVPAIQETIPSKLFEIMACERPVIGSLGGEAAHVIRTSDCGLVCPPEDVGGIVAAVEELAGMTPVERVAMGARGRQYVLAHFSREHLARTYFNLLTRLTGRIPT